LQGVDILARVRVRQHVNPLSKAYQKPITPPNWQQIYAHPHQPLHLDIGCARGRLLQELAPQSPQWNFLGTEIRHPLVDEANRWRDEQELSNLHFLFCNINTSAAPLLQSLPENVLQCVSILFPDPWFKKRHQKRRMVQPSLVALLAQYLVSGGRVILASDVESVATQMWECFAAHPTFACESQQWLPENPLPTASEREIATLNKGEPVYRTVFVKK
jgi:tRNA (guanine-N7-)-methyltransferase